MNAIVLYGPNQAEAKRQAAAAKASADAAAISVLASQAAARFYSTIAAGVAATTTGQLFTSNEGGTWNYYLRTGTTPFYSLFRPVLSVDASGNLTLNPTWGWTTGALAVLYLGDANNFLATQNGGSTNLQSFSDVTIASGSPSVELARFTKVTSQRALFNASVRPTFDNVFDLGGAANRWTTVFATTGTINTSDERQKVWRGAMSAAELAAARRIVAELGFFQWADAVAEKGAAGARYHFGVRAQQVWGIMADEGLVDPIGPDGKPGAAPYAFLCFDEWPDEPASDPVLDGAGAVVQPGTAAVAGGNRFGLRIDQLSLFLIAAQEARLAALEEAAA